jgi:hypothetical protein
MGYIPAGPTAATNTAAKNIWTATDPQKTRLARPAAAEPLATALILVAMFSAYNGVESEILSASTADTAIQEWR